MITTLSLRDTLVNQFNAKEFHIRPGAITRFECLIPSLDILSFLKVQTISQQYFWEDRDRTFQVAGIGSCVEFSSHEKKSLKTVYAEIQQLIEDSDDGVKAFLGTSFLDHIQDTSLWGNFGSYTMMIPLVELHQTDEGVRFAFNYLMSKEATIQDAFNDVMSQLVFQDNGTHSTSQVLSTSFSPTKEEWKALVDTLRHLIEEKKLHKAVLARETKLDMDSSLLCHDLLLKNTVSQSYSIMFRNKADESFVSVSPERLFLRQKDTVLTEAIAGTRARGRHESEDKELEYDLMRSHKDSEEHQFVLDMIKEKLYSLCDVITETSTKTVLKLDYAQHLYFSVLGVLKESCSDMDLLRTLHPTPAVGGFPTKEALDFIDLNEPFDRGWYSGALVLIEKNRTEAVVGIRSALLSGKTVDLFSGAGIVDRSIAETEWEELNTKIIPFLSLING